MLIRFNEVLWIGITVLLSTRSASMAAMAEEYDECVAAPGTIAANVDDCADLASQIDCQANSQCQWRKYKLLVQASSSEPWSSAKQTSRRLGRSSEEDQDNPTALQSVQHDMQVVDWNTLVQLPQTTTATQSPEIFAQRRQIEEGHCNVCGTQGSCLRKNHLLGDSYSVTVTGLHNTTSAWFATCRAPGVDPSDCFYSPNNESPRIIDEGTNLLDAYLDCPTDSCCNYIYSRNRNDAIPQWSNPACTSGLCRYIERYCLVKTTTFSCPVGSVMVIGKSDIQQDKRSEKRINFSRLSHTCAHSYSRHECDQHIHQQRRRYDCPLDSKLCRFTIIA